MAKLNGSSSTRTRKLPSQPPSRGCPPCRPACIRQLSSPTIVAESCGALLEIDGSHINGRTAGSLRDGPVGLWLWQDRKARKQNHEIIADLHRQEAVQVYNLEVKCAQEAQVYFNEVLISSDLMLFSRAGREDADNFAGGRTADAVRRARRRPRRCSDCR